MEPLAVLIGVFAVFLPALILPGPDFVAVARSTLTFGARAGFATALGVTLGLCFYAALGLAGLSTLLAAHAWLATAVRVLGGAYLVYLGLRLITRPRTAWEAEVGRLPMKRNALLFGLGVTLTNPKAIVLFASVFATAVTPATPVWLVLAMMALVGAASFAWYGLVSLCLSRNAVTRRVGWLGTWIERVAGGTLVVLGGRVLADARQPMTP